jgi:hypothetical protein
MSWVYNPFTGTFDNTGSGGGSGDVVGPASSTDNAIVRYDLTTGKLIQNSSATLSDTGVLVTSEITALTHNAVSQQINFVGNSSSNIEYNFVNDSTNGSTQVQAQFKQGGATRAALKWLRSTVTFVMGGESGATTAIQAGGVTRVTIDRTSGQATFTEDVLVPDEAYGSGWDGSLEVPTKNALYDKIETISDPLWEEVTGDYTALTQVDAGSILLNVGTVEATPYTIGGGITPGLNIDADFGAGALNIVGLSSHGSGGFFDLGSLLFFNRSRGSQASPTALQNGDYIGGQVFGGYGSGDYQLALTGLLSIATDDWDVNPGASTLSWLMNASTIFTTDSLNLTTVYNPFHFITGVGMGTAPDAVANNKLRIGTADTADSATQALFATGNAAVKALVIQGTTSQSANLTEWQDDTGAILASIDFAGNLLVPDEAYGAGWNGSNEVPTKNSVYDKIQLVDKRSVSIQVTDGATNVSVADGVAYFTIPEILNGFNLTRAQATVVTAGTTGASTVMIHNLTSTANMLSGAISIASGGTVGTVGTIDTAEDDVATNDIIRIDVDSVSTTAPKGLMVVLEFSPA